MSNTARFVAALSIGLAVPLTTFAQTATRGIHFFAGYESLHLNHSFAHNTHPGDFFLPRAAVPGSAGETRLARVSFATVGAGYAFQTLGGWQASVELAALLGGDRDRRKNANDPRPDATSAFVYSEARYGALAAFALTRSFHALSVGVQAQIAGVHVEDGYDRFNADERQHSSLTLLPSVGPKVGYALTNHVSFEGTVQLGRSVGFGLQTKLRF